MLNDESDFVENTIKSVNELCDEVIVIVPKIYNINKYMLKNLGAKIIESDSTDNNTNFMLGVKNSSCKYTLYLNPNEILSTKNQTLLYNSLLHEKDVNFLNLPIKLINKDIESLELRLFKNTEKIKQINSFNSFFNLAKQSRLYEADMIIYRY